MWESLPLGKDCDRCFTIGYSLLDFQHDLGKKAEPFSFLCFLFYLCCSVRGWEWSGQAFVFLETADKKPAAWAELVLWGRAGISRLTWWQVRWGEEVAVFVVCLINRIDACEVWSDRSRLMHVLKVKQEEIFLCNLSYKSQKCFWLQGNWGALTIPLWIPCGDSVLALALL